jgi:hypothetical protein
MFRIRRFSVIKTSNVVALIYMIIVAIFAVPFGLLVAIAGVGSNQVQGGAVGGIAFALIAILGYGLFGWIFTAIGCLIYNLAAGWVGGIEVQVEAVAPPPPPPAWMPSTTPPPPAQPPSAQPPTT